MVLEQDFLFANCVSVFTTCIFLTCCLVYVDVTHESLCYPWFVPLVLWFGFFAVKMARDFGKSRKHAAALSELKKLEKETTKELELQKEAIEELQASLARGRRMIGRGERGVSPTTPTEEEPPTWV